MIPDNVEKIIMTKEDYDRNVEQLLVDKCKAELEVERLNNIIDELEKYIKKEIGDIKNNYSQVNGNYFNMNYVIDTYENVLDKLNELKGDNK